MTHPKKVWHHSEEKGWHQITMEAIDANHAVEVDPDHWAFEKPAEEKVEEFFGKDPAKDDGDAA